MSEQVTIGSIWRENDKRFERFVKIVGLDGGKVAIANCRADGSWESPRTTKASAARFGKAYKIHSTSAPATSAPPSPAGS